MLSHLWPWLYSQLSDIDRNFIVIEQRYTMNIYTKRFILMEKYIYMSTLCGGAIWLKGLLLVVLNVVLKSCYQLK